MGKTPLYRPPVQVSHRITSSRVEVGQACTFLDLNTDAPCARCLTGSGILRCGIDIIRDRFLAGTDRSDDHLVYFVVEGDVTAVMGASERRLTAGELLLAGIDRALWLRLEEGQTCRGVFFHMRDTTRWFALERGEVLVRQVIDPRCLHNAVEQLVAESLSGNDDANEVGKHHAALVLLYLDRELMNIAEPHVRIIRHKLFRMWDHVAATVEQPWTTERLALELNVSKGYLHRLVREYMGTTPAAMLRRIRIERAKLLLVETDLTLAQVAEAVGYESAYSFSNAFMRDTGCRPGGFRKRTSVG